MKKIMVITTLLLFAASTSFAELSISMGSALTKASTGKTVYGAASGSASTSTPQIGKTSSGVGVGLLCVATGSEYSLVTQHQNGTKAYGSTYDSTSILSKDVTTVGTPLLPVPTVTTTADFTGWTAL